MDDPDEMFQLADLLKGVSVDCAELSSESHSPGMNNLIVTCICILKLLLTNKIFWAVQKTKRAPQTVMKISGNYITRIC